MGRSTASAIRVKWGDAGYHTLRATLLSVDFHHAYSELPPLNATPGLPVAGELFASAEC